MVKNKDRYVPYWLYKIVHARAVRNRHKRGLNLHINKLKEKIFEEFKPKIPELELWMIDKIIDDVPEILFVRTENESRGY